MPLGNKLEPNEKINVYVSYQFTLPEKGLRFTKNEDNYFLAQWYPMVPTYRDGWNKEEYRFRGESYHTTFSNFKLEYDIPKELTIVTSSDDDQYPSKNRSSVEVEEVKELFIAILKKPTVIQKNLGNINVRVFGVDANLGAFLFYPMYDVT